jgi:hypothetical protein
MNGNEMEKVAREKEFWKRIEKIRVLGAELVEPIEKLENILAPFKKLPEIKPTKGEDRPQEEIDVIEKLQVIIDSLNMAKSRLNNMMKGLEI